MHCAHWENPNERMERNVHLTTWLGSNSSGWCGLHMQHRRDRTILYNALTVCAYPIDIEKMNEKLIHLRIYYCVVRRSGMKHKTHGRPT